MMKFLSKIAKRSLPVIAVIVLATVLFVGRASAIPYAGDTTPPTPSPQFNAYTGVPSEGDESDFFRGKVAGNTSPSTNIVDSTCETGKQFTLRVYVHNGASQYQNGNGDGPSVAKNTKLKVNLKNANAQSSFNPEATISASNAASVNDSMTIRCSDGKVVKLSYVNGTAAQYTRTGSKPIDGAALFTTGAPIGTDQPDGNVWGCWEQRVYVTFNVEVKEQPQPKPSKGECKVLDIKPLGGRKIEANLSGATDNAKIVDYRIFWDWENNKNDVTTGKKVAEHEYAKDGTYKIVGEVLVEYANGDKKWVTANDCAKQITFKPDVPPVPTPVTPTPATPSALPSTGPGEVVAIFTAISIAAGVAYRVYIARRLGA